MTGESWVAWTHTILGTWLVVQIHTWKKKTKQNNGKYALKVLNKYFMLPISCIFLLLLLLWDFFCNRKKTGQDYLHDGHVLPWPSRLEDQQKAIFELDKMIFMGPFQFGTFYGSTYF